LDAAANAMLSPTPDGVAVGTAEGKPRDTGKQMMVNTRIVAA